VALGFSGFVWFEMGFAKWLEFMTGYIIEYSLSMDNMFVFVMIFSYFAVLPKHQPRILRWGILGAIVMRFILIFSGVALIKKFHWIIYVFGAVLIVTALKMLRQKEERIDPSQNLALKFFKKIMPFDGEDRSENFFVKKNGVLCATAMFATVIVIEASDLVFAVDSIPAVLAISQDPFIVYTSNVFAILGLRALYFLLAGIMGVFAYLKYGISAVLFFVGAKMLLSGVLHISTGISLLVVAATLAVSILASVAFGEK
ncbi:MAG: TerC/Alx family metal homeostasis membrane protein, partial [Elusimicrobia bacterium]|nr:TerC/Alx family metal homeostasis membrane protein [Elusimicrobiota bacterium]